MTSDRHLERDTYWVARLIGYLVYAVVVITEVILVLGFFLQLFGANPGAPFTDWAYRNLERAMSPFRGIFGEIELGTTSQDVEAVLDVSILFAMIVYGIIALALRSLIDWLSGRIRKVDAADAWDQQVAYQQAVAASHQGPAVDLTQAPGGAPPPPYGQPYGQPTAPQAPPGRGPV